MNTTDLITKLQRDLSPFNATAFQENLTPLIYVIGDLANLALAQEQRLAALEAELTQARTALDSPLPPQGAGAIPPQPKA